MENIYKENYAQNCFSEYYFMQIVVNQKQTKPMLFEKTYGCYVKSSFDEPQVPLCFNFCSSWRYCDSSLDNPANEWDFEPVSETSFGRSHLPHCVMIKDKFFPHFFLLYALQW